MNITAVFALIIGVVLVFVSQKLNGSSLSLFIQPEAFCIVFGGTLCAVLLNFNYVTVMNSFKQLKSVFVNVPDGTLKIVEEIVQISHFARRSGLVSMQALLDKVSDPFLARGLQLAIDLNNPQLLHDILSAEISYDEEESLTSSRVFEAFGGYAPTFGIAGAVMGLIQVMKDLTNLELLGVGIATAFVATLYGVASANLIFLPIAGNLKQQTRQKILLKEVILQGVISIMMQENPAVIEEKLIAYLKFHHNVKLKMAV